MNRRDLSGRRRDADARTLQNCKKGVITKGGQCFLSESESETFTFLIYLCLFQIRDHPASKLLKMWHLQYITEERKRFRFRISGVFGSDSETFNFGETQITLTKAAPKQRLKNKWHSTTLKAKSSPPYVDILIPKANVSDSDSEKNIDHPYWGGRHIIWKSEKKRREGEREKEREKRRKRERER